MGMVKVGGSEHVRHLETVRSIKARFNDQAAVAFLTSTWQERRTRSGIPSTGFCYVASWAYFSLMGGEKAGLRVFKTGRGEDGHFWVESIREGRVDITADQFPDGFDYSEGRVRAMCSDPYAVGAFLRLIKSGV